jgi:hypothetical protein
LGSLLGSMGHRVKPRTLILDFTMTHTRYGRSIQHTTGQLTHTRRYGAPAPDGDLQKVVRDKIRHYVRKHFGENIGHEDFYTT